MRLSTLVLGLSLATAAFAFLPSAEATSLCTFKSPDGCGGWVCADVDKNGHWSGAECASKSDIDSCQHQSDCCRSMSVWCPEVEDS